MKKQVIAVSLVLLALVSVGIAGVALAQTQNAATDQATTSSTTSTTTATSDTSSCTCKDGPAFGGSVFRGMHEGARDMAQGYNNSTASSRQQVKSWYEQLPQEQKTALQDNLQQARESWYQQLPQDQKDKLTTMLDQLSQDERNRIENEFGIQ